MSRAVAIGRRMKGSDIFIDKSRYGRSWSTAARTVSAAGRPCRRFRLLLAACRLRGRNGSNSHAGSQAVLAVHHDLLADSKPVRDNRHSILESQDIDGSAFDGLVGFDSKGEVAFRPLLHRRGRYRDRVVANSEHEPGVDKLAGPERLIMISERRLQVDRSGRGIDLIVDQRQLAVGQDM